LNETQDDFFAVRERSRDASQAMQFVTQLIDWSS